MKENSRQEGLSVLFFVLLSALFMSCGPQQMESVPSAPQPEESVVEEGPSETVVIQGDMEGLVVFLSGDVFLTRGGEEIFLDIGDSVLQSDTVSTGPDGYCEIQLGEMAVIRMDADSILQIQSLVIEEKGNRLDLDLESGTVLCKVKKLLDDDSFQVKTNTVVCGVRGTQFSVSADQESETVLAVKEGAVAVTPLSLEKVSVLAVEEEALAPLAARIEEAALVVSASEELTVQLDTFRESEELAAIVESVVQKVEEKKRTEDALGREDSQEAQEELAVLLKEVEQEVETLLVSLDESPETLAPAQLEIQEISEESEELLKTTESMELITFSAAAADEETLPLLYRVRITAEPADALISGSGAILGRGNYEKLYSQGSPVNLEISLEGYETQSLILTVDEANSGDFSIILEKSMVEEPVSESDSDSVLTAAPMETPGDSPAETLVEATVRVEPADADLMVDGVPVSGTWKNKLPEGTVISIEASRSGFETVSKKLSIEASSASHVIRLAPRPVEATSDLGMSRPVGILKDGGDLFIAADDKGALTAFDRMGDVLWSYRSANQPNANSSPVVHGGRVYFSGGAELVVLDLNTGAAVNTLALEEERSHIYGRRVVPAGDRLYLPANGEIVLIDADASELGTLPLGSGSSMSPAIWSGKAVIADKKGVLLIIDPEDGSILSTIPTSASQSVAQAPAIFADKAVFCSRKGVVAAVDLSSGTVLWERELGSTVFADVIASEEGCFVYSARRELFALSWESGEDLFGVMKDITSVPGYEKGQLVITDKSGSLKLINAASGVLLRQMDLKDSFTARPIVRDGIIVGVGSGGQFYRINMEGIRE